MNSETLKGNWKQLKGMVKEQWGKLTDDDLDVIDGKRDQLVGRKQRARCDGTGVHNKRTARR